MGWLGRELPAPVPRPQAAGSLLLPRPALTNHYNLPPSPPLCNSQALTGDRAGPATAAAALEELFAGRGKAAPRRPTIVLVDEMDVLVNRSQSVLYNLFDWPGRRGSRLSIIGVANTMDLPERLHPRIGSRLAGRRIVFHPYSKDQLSTIVASRLEGVAAFDARAVALVAMKVANCSGDVRRCLELCRRAAELAQERLHRQERAQEKEKEGGGAAAAAGSEAGPSSSAAAAPLETGTVALRHVADAIKEMFSSSHAVMMRRAPRLQRLLLLALHLEGRYSGRCDAALGDVADRLAALCALHGEPEQPFSAVLEAAADLGAKRLILCDPGGWRLCWGDACRPAPSYSESIWHRPPSLHPALPRRREAGAGQSRAQCPPHRPRPRPRPRPRATLGGAPRGAALTAARPGLPCGCPENQPLSCPAHLSKVTSSCCAAGLLRGRGRAQPL